MLRELKQMPGTVASTCYPNARDEAGEPRGEDKTNPTICELDFCIETIEDILNEFANSNLGIFKDFIVIISLVFFLVVCCVDV